MVEPLFVFLSCAPLGIPAFALGLRLLDQDPSVTLERMRAKEHRSEWRRPFAIGARCVGLAVAAGALSAWLDGSGRPFDDLLASLPFALLLCTSGAMVGRYVRAASGRSVGTCAGIGLSALLLVLTLFPVIVGGSALAGVVLLCEPRHHSFFEDPAGD